MLHAVTAEALTEVGTQRVLVGTSGRGSQGIYLAEFSHGTLSKPVLVAEAERPGFLARPAMRPERVFAETQADNQPSRAAAYDLSPAKDGLVPRNQASSKGTGGCHISTTRDGRCIFVSNYGDGSLTSFLADKDGTISLASHFVFPAKDHGPHPERQTQSHVHSAVPSPDGAFVLVNDLGLDCIHVFRLDNVTARLTPNSPAQWKARCGSGPRHLALHPNGRWIYSINELDSTIDQLAWNPTHGLLTLKSTVQTLPSGVPAGPNRACDMVFSKDLRFLYASNRVHEDFAVFAVEPDSGALALVQHLTNPGKESRHMAVDPSGSYLLSANQFSDEISFFPIDKSTGRLQARSGSTALGGPSCLLFL